MKVVFLHSLLDLILFIPQMDPETPSKGDRLFAILILVLLMGFAIAIYFLVQSKRVLQTKYNKIEKQTHQIEEENDELAFANDSLRTFNDEKNNVISIVAHDLKTPLGNVEGLANLIYLEKDKLSKTQLNYLDLIIQTTKKARETVDVMLDVHRIEAEAQVMEKVKHNFLDLLNEVIEMHTAYAKEQNVKIELMDHVRTKDIHTDGNYFKQIISNILSNAIRFSPENEKVIILVTEKDHSIRFDISDSGPGIDPEVQKRLFSTYSKIDVANQGKVTGMGLYIARKLVEKLNGKIRVESSGEEGTTFSVEFFK